MDRIRQESSYRMTSTLTRALTSLILIVVLGFLALCVAFFVYALFFYLVIIDGYQLQAVFQKFYTSVLVAVLLIPIELFLHVTRRRSLIQYGWVLLVLAVVLDSLVSAISFYRPDNIFFSYIAAAIEMDRFSPLLLANEVLASVLAILAALLVLVTCQPLPIWLNLIDQRGDNASNHER